MAVFKRLKEFYKEWLEPPALRRWRTKPPSASLQKMWCGEPVPAPPAERAYFAALNLDGVTITRRDDSRHCANVTTDARLPVPAIAPDASVQLAITADAWREDSTVRLTLGDRVITHSSLKAGRWLDVRIDGPAAASELTIACDQPVWVSVPRVVRRTRAARAESRHILLLVLDGMSRRMLEDGLDSPDGESLTPNLDRLFENGVDAPLGFAASDWTLPTTASFFTGVLPSRHRMVHPVFPMKYPADRVMLAEALQAAGYHTLALSAGNRLTPAFDAHRGFDRFIYHWAYEGRSTFDYDPSVWVSEIVGHLRTHANDRTFTYAHFPDTHPAWDLPPLTRAFNLQRRGNSSGHLLPKLERSRLGRDQGRQLLMLRLRELDVALGLLVDHVERHLADRAIVVLTADHGTPWHDFPDTNPPTRPSLNEFRIGTALKLRAPGIARATVHGAVCPNLDMMPTLFALAGLTPPPDLDGVNLLGAPPSARMILSESIYRNVYEVSVSDGEGQWIEKYPLDERTNHITGPRSYAGFHRRGARSYDEPAASSHPAREPIVQAHLRRVGLLAG